VTRRRLIAAASATLLYAGLAGAARAAPLCGAGLRGNCRAAERSRLVISHSTKHAKNRLSWAWLHGAATTLEELGGRTGSTGYALCIYAGMSTAAIAEADIPPSPTLWRPEGTTGFRYRDPSRSSNGIREAILKAGRAGQAKAVVRGRGGDLPDPPAGPLPLPVTVQLVNSVNPVCFEGVYDATVAKRNDAETFKAAPHATWVGTWSASPLCFRAATLLGLPATTRFDDQSIRMIVHTSIGGDAVRVRLTNQCGTDPLEIGAATIGMSASGASLRPNTVRPLTFAAQSSVSVPPGSTVASDPVVYTLPPLSDLTITLYLPDATLPTTSHPQAATGYLSGSGDFTASVDGSPFQTPIRQWFFLASVDVLALNDASAIVAFGDSIIDGAGSTYDANARWPDFLARRLVAADKPFGVLNQGINGNKVLNSLLGNSALVRFDRDVLGQTGAKYVILLEGLNDIGLGNPDVTADQVIAGYRELIDRAHAGGLKIFGGTLTPAEGAPYPFYHSYDESKRQAINQFIREGGAFDGVLDFAAAVSDPADPSHWRTGLSADSLHPSDAGAEVIADAIDLSLWRRRARWRDRRAAGGTLR